MRASGGGYRVAVLGAVSLLGRELEKILRERRFPFSTFAAVEQGDESLESEFDPEEEIPGLLSMEEAADVEWDFLFLAGSGALDTALVGAVLDHGGWVIDLVDGNGVLDCGGEIRIVSFPLREFTAKPARRANLFGSPHPATILLAALTGNLERKFSIAAATAEVFESASARGGEGIKELQEQTWNLLQFQKIPKEVFGAQLAFNVLPRLGTERARKGGLAEGGVLRRELEYFLSGSLLMPVPRVFQLPVFYSIAVSFYVELTEPISLEEVEQALAGSRVQVRPERGEPATLVDVLGADSILAEVNPAKGPSGADFWIWAVADNVHVAALNAVEIAESFVDGGIGGGRVQ